MKKIILMASALLLFLAIFSLQAQEQKKIEVKLLWEKNLGDDVEALAISEEEIAPGNITQDILAITYKNIKVLDKKGNVTFELSCSGGIYPSKKGKYFGMITQIQEGEDYNFSLYTKKGKLVSEFKIFPYNSNSPLISDSDGTVMIWGDNPARHIPRQTVVAFYSKFGGKLREYKGIGDKPFSAVASADISENGHYFALLVSSLKKVMIPKPHYGWGATYLILFDKEGNELWEKELPARTASSVAVSENGEYIVASMGAGAHNEEEVMYVYTKDGVEIYRSPYGFMEMRIKDEKYLVEGFGINGRILDLKSGQIIWEKENSGSLLDVNKKFIITKFSNANPPYLTDMFLYDWDRNLIWQKTSSSHLKGKFLNRGKNLIISEGNQISGYEIIE